MHLISLLVWLDVLYRYDIITVANVRPIPERARTTDFFLEQRKVVETSSSAWKADVFTVIRPLHIRTQLTKHYCTITGELGIIVVKGDQQTVRNHSMTVVGVRGLEPPRLSTIAPKATAYCQISPYAHINCAGETRTLEMDGSKPSALDRFATTHRVPSLLENNPTALLLRSWE